MPEFTSEYETGGGLGNYLNRITRALADAGHAPEVFVSSNTRAGDRANAALIDRYSGQVRAL